MAKQNVVIDISAKDNGASRAMDSLLQKAKELERNDALNSLGSGGSIGSLAKSLRRGDAMSGERALGSYLNRGAGGLADFGMSAVGFGAAGLIANFVTESTAKLTDEMLLVQQGKKTLTEVFAEFARGIPIIGGLGHAISNLIDLGLGVSAKTASRNAYSAMMKGQRDNATGVLTGVEKMAEASSAASMVGIINATEDPATAAYQNAKNRLDAEVKALREQIATVNMLDDKFEKEKLRQVDNLNRAIALKEEEFRVSQDKRNREAEEKKREREMEFIANLEKAEEDALRQGFAARGRTLDAQIAEIRANARRKRSALDTASAGMDPSNVDAAYNALDEGERMAIQAANNDAAKRRKNAQEELTELRAELYKLNNPVSNYQSKFESGMGGSGIGGRFNTGQGELILMRTANTDTARNTGEIKRQQEKIIELMREQNEILRAYTQEPSYSGTGRN